MPKPKKSLGTMSFKAEDDLLDRVKQEAEALNTSASELIREALAARLGFCPTCGQACNPTPARDHRAA